MDEAGEGGETTGEAEGPAAASMRFVSEADRMDARAAPGVPEVGEARGMRSSGVGVDAAEAVPGEARSTGKAGAAEEEAGGAAGGMEEEDPGAPRRTACAGSGWEPPPVVGERDGAELEEPSGATGPQAGDGANIGATRRSDVYNTSEGL